MNINSLITPTFLVDIDILEKNIEKMNKLCSLHNLLCPMVKTHKCSEIALLQQNTGARSFLVGTLDEVEVLVDKGIKDIVIPYPITNPANIKRLIEVSKKSKITISLDGLEATKIISNYLETYKLELDYLLIIDSGLHRFGVAPLDAGKIVKEIFNYSNLKFKGISTHPGHVYSVDSYDGVIEVAKGEIAALELAKKVIEENKFLVEIIATGSTPTVKFVANTKQAYTLRPGNYVFNDAIQVSLGVVTEDECSFSVLATVISRPNLETLIIDAGSKCLGLDKGAHGNKLIKSFGIVKDHPELLIESLSEEVGKVKILSNTDIKVGDKIQIIPNHACASANMTSYYIGCRKNHVEKIYYVDARGNSILKNKRM